MNSFEFTNSLNQLPFHYWAKIVKVKDGDTVVAEVDLGFHTKVKKTFRIYQDDDTVYFDTPEVKKYRGVTEEHKAHGLEAKARAEELLLDKTVILYTHKKGSFRWLAEIYYPVQSEDLNELPTWNSYVETMINEGFQKKEDYS